MKYTRSVLQKLENTLKSSDYVVRYEKGQFKSGYCILENKKIVILNTFFDVQARIETFISLYKVLNLELPAGIQKNEEVFTQNIL